MTELISISQLQKSYKKNPAVAGVSFCVYEGEILCVLGPNGAGKSTTIKLLTGAMRPDGGEIASRFTGGDIRRDLNGYKKQLGIVPQELALYEDISAYRNVEFFASLYGLKGEALQGGCRFALEFVGLWQRAKDKVNTFSGGMKRRLNIACALAHRPRLLVMDEPTVGIDPQSRNHILQSIKRMRQQGMTILYTTHYMEEVEEISTRIIVMDKGGIIATGTKEQLKESTGRERLITIRAEGLEGLNTDALYAIEGVRRVSNDGALKISAIRGIENLDRIIALLIEQSIKISSITTEETSLEWVFLNLTGRSLRD